MRQLGIVLVFGVGVGVGCAAGTAVAEAQAPVGGTRWEYKCVWQSGSIPNKNRKEEEANSLGREGWEMADETCFKRPLP